MLDHKLVSKGLGWQPSELEILWCLNERQIPEEESPGAGGTKAHRSAQGHVGAVGGNTFWSNQERPLQGRSRLGRNLHKGKGASLVAQMLTSPLAMQKNTVWFLGQEDPLEKETATYSSIFAWRIPKTEEPGSLQSVGCKELDTTEQLTHTHTHTHTCSPSNVSK